MICVAVSYVLKEGREAEAIGHLRPLAAATRQEPGCRLYLVHRDPDDPRRVFLYEQYDDQAALDAHRAAPLRRARHQRRLPAPGEPVAGDL